MVKNVITEEHKREARKLKAIYAAKAKTLKLTQEKLGIKLGGTGQSTASNYLNGITALNLKSALVFARELGVQVDEFSPRLSALIGGGQDDNHSDWLDRIIRAAKGIQDENERQRLALIVESFVHMPSQPHKEGNAFAPQKDGPTKK